MTRSPQTSPPPPGSAHTAAPERSGSSSPGQRDTPARADSGSAAGTDAPPAFRVQQKPRRLPGERGRPPIVALTWATFFGAGYFPIAPGTAATAAAIPLWWLLTHLPTPLYILATIAVALTGIAAAGRAGRYYGVADSGHIVIDEVAGYLVTMLFLPRGLLPALCGFAFFRLFDVLKPPPARFFDRDARWKNGAGVVLDDVFAGVWAWAATWIVQLAAWHLGAT